MTLSKADRAFYMTLEPEYLKKAQEMPERFKQFAVEKRQTFEQDLQPLIALG